MTITDRPTDQLTGESGQPRVPPRSGADLQWTIAPASRAAWSQVLASDPHALASQAPGWVDAMTASGPWTDATLQLTDPSGRRLILPMVRRSSVPARVATHHTMPDRWGTGGLLAEDGRLTADDVRATMRLLAARTSGPLVIVPDPHLDPLWREAAPWSYSTAKWSYELDTSAGYEEVWDHRFRSSVRRAVRKAERSGVHIEHDTTGQALRHFLPLYQESVLRWAQSSGMPASVARWRASRLESLAKFERVARAFGDSCATWLAYVNDQPAAGIVVLTQGGNADYWRGAMSLPLAGPVRANDLLHARAIEEACRQGARRYSFGISEPGSSLARFKEGFGATAVPYRGYVLERVPVRRAIRSGRRVLRRGVVTAAEAGRRLR